MYAQDNDQQLPATGQSGTWCNWSFKLIQADLIPGAVAVKPGGTKYTAYEGAWMEAGNPDSAFVGARTVKPGEVKSILNCPSLSSRALRNTSESRYINAYATPRAVLGTAAWSRYKRNYIKTSTFERASEVVAAYDGTNFHPNLPYVGQPWAGIWNEQTKSNLNGAMAERHNQQGNVVMLDGHAEAARIENATDEMYPVRLPN
jgi:prepilin-type processing-associated H-X9-DG protein